MARKVLILVLALTMIMSTSAFAVTLTDTKGHWAEAYVKDLVDKKVINGYADGTFRPDENITYFQFIKLLYHGVLKEDPKDQGLPGYEDFDYYSSAVVRGIISKDVIPSYVTDNKLTRKDMAYLLRSFVKGKMSDEEIEVIEDYIADIEDSRERKSDVIFTYGMGISGGYPDNTFRPDEKLTRAESAVIISRAMNPDTRIKLDYEKIKNRELPELTETSSIREFMYRIPKRFKKPNVVEGFRFNDERAYRGIENYVILENSPFKFKQDLDLIGDVMIVVDERVTYLNNMVLVKDNNVIYRTQNVPYKGIDQFGILEYEGTKVPDFDYIGFYVGFDLDIDTMVLIKNPFK